MIAVTGYGGTFDVSPLGDEPTSSHYDSVHMQARGREETWDIAMRLWHLDPEAAEKRFEGLLDELPNAKVKNELGDRSLRASTTEGDILGVAYLDKKRGVVVQISCGAAQCKTAEAVYQLVRRVKEKLDTQITEATP